MRDFRVAFCRMLSNRAGNHATPALQWACRQWNQWGAMITASHNPLKWNGINSMEKTGRD
jgi:phosphomannomutase